MYVLYVCVVIQPVAAKPNKSSSTHLEDVVAEQVPSLTPKSSSLVSPGGACAIVDVESGKSLASLMEAD